MKKSYFSVINRQFSNRQTLYLKDPSSDLFVILNQRLYPLHKDFLTEIEFFSKPQNKEQKIIMVDSNLDAQSFQMIMGYFYGKQLQFFRNWQLDRALQVITYLTIPSLSKIVINDLQHNFQQYGFFLLSAIAYKYKIKWLKDRCQQQLILMDFQQLNYNRYDLFQLDRQTFQEIIKLHQLLKVNQNITGLKDAQLKKIIKQYCKSNNIPDIQINKHRNQFDNSSSLSNQQKLNIQESELRTRKRNSSVPNHNVLNQVQADTPHKSCQIPPTRTEQTIKNEQLQKLKLINEQIHQKNNRLIQQIQSVKLDIEKSTQVKHANSQTQAIDQKFKKFEKMCQQQDKKYLKLKAEMQKLSPSGKIDAFQKQLFQSQTSSTNTQNKSNKLSEIDKNSFFKNLPVLSRNLDS